MDYGSHINLAGNELQNAVTQNLATAPSSPKKGQMYFNTTTNVTMVWNGLAWRPLDAAALTDGTISNAALATNPLARANHTGTQVAATISNLAATVQAYSLSLFAVPTANLSMNSKEIVSLLDPTTAQSAATKNYVDGAVQSAAAGIDSKASVRVVSTANITLSGTQTIDGIAVVAGDAVLCPAQTTGSQNGVYIVAAGAWARRANENVTGEITPGAFWFVEEGTVYGKTQWRCNNTGAITLGTTAISIVQFGAAAMYSAGSGLSLTGSVFAVLAKAGGGLVSDGTGVYLDTTTVTRKFSSTVAHDGTTVAFTITHNLNTTDVQVVVRNSTGAQVLVDNQANGANTCVVTWAAPQTSGTTFRVIVQG